MLKLLLGSAMLVFVLSFVACNAPVVPSGPLADCPTNISVVSDVTFSYSVPSCQLKVGSSLTIEANLSHPLKANGSTPLVAENKTTNFTYTAVAGDVGKDLGYQCAVHGPSMSGIIRVVAAQ
jgi:hypothetical protein